MAWLLRQGILPDTGHHGRTEEFETEWEARRVAKLQADCDRENGREVVGSAKKGYVVDGFIYIKVEKKN